MTNTARRGASLKMGNTIIVQHGQTKTIIKIRLDDECGNGHADFSMTCEIYEKRGNHRWVDAGGGCAHAHILKLRPDLKLFADLHLCDFTGAPMYAIENGFYHLHDAEKTRPERLAIAARHFRCTLAEAELLEKCEDKERMAYTVERLGLPKQWQAEADEAIARLEAWGAPKFNPAEAGKSPFHLLSSEQRAGIEKREKDGYYTPEAEAERVKKAREAKHDSELAEINAGFEKEECDLRRGRTIKLWLAERCYALNNAAPDETQIDHNGALYYGHTNTVVFNWRVYGQRITPADLKRITDSITPADLAILPEGIKFTLKG